MHFGDFAKLTENEVMIGLKDKLMGQVNQVPIGRDYANDNGSFTLTSGVLSHDPIRFGACASLVNGALDCFVRAAAIELPRGLRINVIGPGYWTSRPPRWKPCPASGSPTPMSSRWRVALRDRSSTSCSRRRASLTTFRGLNRDERRCLR